MVYETAEFSNVRATAVHASNESSCRSVSPCGNCLTSPLGNSTVSADCSVTRSTKETVRDCDFRGPMSANANSAAANDARNTPAAVRPGPESANVNISGAVSSGEISIVVGRRARPVNRHCRAAVGCLSG